MGLSLLFLFSINTFPEKQLLIYHDYGDLYSYSNTFFLETIVLNQKTGTVIPILRFARDRP